MISPASTNVFAKTFQNSEIRVISAGVEGTNIRGAYDLIVEFRLFILCFHVGIKCS